MKHIQHHITIYIYIYTPRLGALSLSRLVGLDHFDPGFAALEPGEGCHHQRHGHWGDHPKFVVGLGQRPSAVLSDPARSELGL